jgi:D-alanine--poly(phosphoribitol) ligase subunit 1
MSKHYYNLGLLFSEVVVVHAQRPALRYPEHLYSYSDLSQWVDKLALLLIANGLRPGDVIAIGNSKRPLSYALMLAAMRLGIAYVNIDVASPLARNSRILEVSGATLLFYDDPKYEQGIQDLAQNNNCKALALEFDGWSFNCLCDVHFWVHRNTQRSCGHTPERAAFYFLGSAVFRDQ